MEKQILTHQTKLNDELVKLGVEKGLAKSVGAKEIWQERVHELEKWHARRISDFQAERLAHLLVTLFFGFLFLIFFLMAITLGPVSARIWGEIWPTIVLYILTGLVLITEIFYIRHYFVLENSLQKLYLQTDEIWELLK